MKQQRRFAIAPSFLRLIRRERPGIRIVEGHFPDQPDRRSHVRLEGERCELVLETVSEGVVSGEERTEVSRAQGEILLDVCAGKVSYERMRLDAGDGPIVVVDRYLSPSVAGVVRIVFDSAEDASAFKPPIWCGPELAAADPIEPRALALGARPRVFDGPIPDAALESLLDILDGLAPRFAGRGRDDAVLNALKRLARPDAAPDAPRQATQAPQAPAQVVPQTAANGVHHAVASPPPPPSLPKPAAGTARPEPRSQATPRAAASAPSTPLTVEEALSAEDAALFEPEPVRPSKPGNGAAGRPS